MKKLEFKIKVMEMRKVMFLLLGLIISIGASAQKPTIAVANPNVEGIESLSSKIAATYIRLELIKLDKFLVFDEFDMDEVLKSNEEYSENCYGLNCLTSLGADLNVDYVMSGSFVGLGDKYAISLKWIDVKNKKLYKSSVREFEAYDKEISRMIQVILREMNDMEVDQLLVDRIKYQEEVITSDNVGKINNSGPRVGGAYLTGTLNEFAIRPEEQGGLGIAPVMSMIGYQIEGQYVGTENFSALVEGLINVGGLEQGEFIPSLSILNGFRFGRAGWEFAFGPSFSIRRSSYGFFDNNNQFGKGEGYYFSDDAWNEYANNAYKNDPDSTYYTDWGSYSPPSLEDVSSYTYSKNFDKKGRIFGINTSWVMAFGRTFKAGSLNIPVNMFYSSTKKGGMLG
ncbi:MAG: hypothetical protein ACWA41_08130, partial [Putridiphycobacter sp.]